MACLIVPVTGTVSVCVCYAVGVYGLPHCSGDTYSVRVCAVL